MSYSNAKRRRIKPFARPTSFDINVAYDIRHYQQIKYGNVVDPYFPAVGTDEAFKVCEGEVLMQQKKPSVRRYGDHQMHVFSFANGLKDGRNNVLNASAQQSPAKYSILAGLRYAGVAVTEFTPEKDVFEQGFVMTMGGLNTLFNNGNSTIYPGDLICADIPNPADAGRKKNRGLQTGVPHDKLQFIVTPYRILSDATKPGGVGPKLASEFIMGTALSYSRPGAPLDVVLHKCRGFTRSDDTVLDCDRRIETMQQNLMRNIEQQKSQSAYASLHEDNRSRRTLRHMAEQLQQANNQLQRAKGKNVELSLQIDDANTALEAARNDAYMEISTGNATLASAESKKTKVKAVKKKPAKN